jgi:hypothetical protein
MAKEFPWLSEDYWSLFPVLIERYNVTLDIFSVRQISAMEFFGSS